MVALDSCRSANTTVNCVCEGSSLHVPYKNLMPDDLRWFKFVEVCFMSKNMVYFSECSMGT